ncbi:MAG: hypothetical protein IJJ06_12105 [Mogibacterium sp.]|nr:hypothetical protein [Mogibacterium sp.]
MLEELEGLKRAGRNRVKKNMNNEEAVVPEIAALNSIQGDFIIGTEEPAAQEVKAGGGKILWTVFLVIVMLLLFALLVIIILLQTAPDSAASAWIDSIIEMLFSS